MADKQRHIIANVLHDLEKSKLIDIILKQRDKIEAQKSVIERLSEQSIEQQEEIARLQKELAVAQRKPHRQNAPFRKEEGDKKDKQKKPGRKPGHQGNFRQPSSDITEQIDVPLCGCPKCQGTLINLQSTKQIIEEIPEIKLRIVSLTTYSGYCGECEEQFYSTHPLQVSHATGAAGVHLGPRATALIANMRHRYGLTTRKVCDFLQDTFDLPLSPGGVCHLEHRLANKLLPDYAALLKQARQADLLQGDETGWYVGSVGYYLFVLTNENLTIYDIRQTRNREQIAELLGPDFDGVFVSDCLNMYDFVSPTQQKCYAHHLKAVDQALNILPKSEYLLKVKSLLKEAIKTKSKFNTAPPFEYQELCKHLENRADHLFPTVQNENGFWELDKDNCSFELKPAEQRVANRIARQRPHLFTFLYHEKVPATNNLSERQIRPAVIQRKLSCGNKTEKGARTWKIIRSIAVSDNQNEKNFEESVFNAIKRDLVPR